MQVEIRDKSSHASFNRVSATETRMRRLNIDKMLRGLIPSNWSVYSTIDLYDNVGIWIFFF